MKVGDQGTDVRIILKRILEK